jgi:hypothetical protein
MARGSKRKTQSKKTSTDDSDDSSYSISQSIPSEEEPQQDDDDEEELQFDSQVDEFEEFCQDVDLGDVAENLPHDELSTIPEGEEVSVHEDTASLPARKAEFYKAVDQKIFSMSKLNKHAHIICDALFDEIYELMLAIQDSDEEEWLKLLRKIGHIFLLCLYSYVKIYHVFSFFNIFSSSYPSHHSHHNFIFLSYFTHSLNSHKFLI